jgi:hypothetical protein
MHALYMPFVGLLDRCGLSGLEAMQLASVLGGVAGVAGTSWIAVELGLPIRRALAAGCLCLLAPTAFFFSTAIEVPALHLGVVALACGVVLSLRRVAAPLGFRAAVLLLVPLLYFAHKSSALLAPGWLALALCCEASRSGRRPGLFATCLWGVALATAFLLSMRLAQTVVPDNSIGDTLRFIERFEQPLDWNYLRDAVWAGLGLLAPLGLFGLSRAPRAERLWMAAFVLPVALFFAWYGEVNYGGYYISLVPILAVLAVRALPSGRSFWLLWGTVVLAQAYLTQRLLTAANFGLDPAEQRAKVEAARRVLGEAGLLVSFDPLNQPVTLRLPGVAEMNLRNELFAYGRSGGTPEAAAREILQTLPARGAFRIAIDLAGLEQTNRRAKPFVEAFARVLETEFGPADRQEPAHPLVLVDR